MKSLASLALLLAAPAFAQEPLPTDRPGGSSQASPGERRFDEVGRADVMEGPATTVRGLAEGDLVEITSLANGKTVLASVTSGSTGIDRLAILSPATAAALELGGDNLVRIRRAVADPQDNAAVRRGDVVRRTDAPPALLAALRKLAPPPAVATPAPTKPARAPRAATKNAVKPVETAKSTQPAPSPAKPAAAAPKIPSTPPKPAPTATGRYLVQVAALSNAASAQGLARKLGGSVAASGKLHRVRLGPFADRAAAEKARARAAAAGYRDAAIQTN